MLESVRLPGSSDRSEVEEVKERRKNDYLPLVNDELNLISPKEYSLESLNQPKLVERQQIEEFKGSLRISSSSDSSSSGDIIIRGNYPSGQNFELESISLPDNSDRNYIERQYSDRLSNDS